MNAVRDCHGKSGNRKIQLLQKIRQISVSRSEIIDPSLPGKDSDSEEVCDIEKRCSELYSELLREKESARKCKEDLRNYKAEMSVLKEENTKTKAEKTKGVDHKSRKGIVVSRIIWSNHKEPHSRRP